MKKLKFFALCVLTGVSASVLAFAATSTQLSIRLKNAALILDSQGSGYSHQQLLQIEGLVQQLEATLAGSHPGPVPPIPPAPGPVPPPGPGPWAPVVYRATCEADDDAQFDPGQFNLGNVQGATVQAMLNDCKSLGRSYVTWSLSNIQIINQLPGAYQVTCEIDDDLQFDPGQFSMGTLIGYSLSQIAQDCALLAEFRYGGNGSSGIQITKSATPNPGMVSAQCEIDDDLQFDRGQFSVGTLVGYSIQQLDQDCAYMAQLRFGQNGSSGLGQVTYH